MLKKCFGIISWLPDEENLRQSRIERLNNLLKMLSELWPDIDILFIAQNWQDFKPININNNILYRFYNKLGIVNARKTLQEEFLKLDYDYIIMLDDDVSIKVINNAHIKYMKELDKHPNGFCFLKGLPSKYHSYIGMPLNLCAISRFIYEQEPMVDVDPQKNEACEDLTYACLLHYKYSQYEFNPAPGIYVGQKWGENSTWLDTKKIDSSRLGRNNLLLQKYIAEHKDLPDNYKDLLN